MNCHRLHGLNNKPLFPAVLEGEASKIKVAAHSVSGEGPLPGFRSYVLIASSHGREQRQGTLRFLRSFHIQRLSQTERLQTLVTKDSDYTVPLAVRVRVSTQSFCP